MRNHFIVEAWVMWLLITVPGVVAFFMVFTLPPPQVMALTGTRLFKPSRCRTALVVAGAFGLWLGNTCSSADETHAIYPPLQIFKEICLDAEWSLQAIAELADQHHYALISSEDVPTPDGSPAHKGIWEANTVIGPVSITDIEGGRESNGHTMTCTVSTPSNSTNFIQAWLKGSFGNPTSTLNKPPNATEIHWTHTFEDGTVDVILLTRMPSENSALLTVMKHKDSPKGSLGSH
jgi:hypothetical protein